MKTLISSISEGIIPEKEVIKSLVNATARKYEIEIKNIYTTEEISEDLIKEVMDTSFIPIKSKNEYCISISNILDQKESSITITSDSQNDKEIELSEAYKYYDRSYRYKSIERTTPILSVLIGIVTSLLAFMSTDEKIISVLKDDSILSTPIVVTTLTVYLLILLLILPKLMSSKSSSAKNRNKFFHYYTTLLNSKKDG